MLIIPAAIMAAVLASQAGKLQEFQIQAKQAKNASVSVKDEWAPFSRLTLVVICRSIIF